MPELHFHCHNPSTFLGWSRRVRSDLSILKNELTVFACTAALGASSKHSGHAKLKHCFLKIQNRDDDIQTFAMGVHGVGKEPFPTHPTTRCAVVAKVSEEHVQKLKTEFSQCGNRPYQWGANDCCTCVIRALQANYDLSIPEFIQTAHMDIKASRPLYS